MLKITFRAVDLDALRYWRVQHPDPRVQVRMEALYLRSQGLAHGDILRLCGMSKASFHRDLHAYIAGGIEPLKQIDHYRPQSELARYRPTLEAYVREHPPATVAEAAAQIQERTGIARKPTQVRQFLQALGMKPRKVGMLPAKADVDAQEAFKKTVWSPGSRKLKRVNAPSSSWTPRMLCVPPFWAWSGVCHACWSRHPQGGNGCMSWRP
jgi:transposase